MEDNFPVTFHRETVLKSNIFTDVSIVPRGDLICLQAHIVCDHSHSKRATDLEGRSLLRLFVIDISVSLHFVTSSSHRDRCWSGVRPCKER